MITLQSLEKLLPLVQSRENLLARIAAINAELKILETGGGRKVERAKNLPKAPNTISKRPRGKLQKSVLKTLKAAGAKGLKVSAIAEKAKVHPPSLRVWLYTAAHKLGVVKVSPGVFAYKA